MWTIVHFINENSVEGVPSHWVKKDMCAWPKKDIKKHINRRTLYNNFDFDLFPSRVLKKGIVNLQDAKSFVKRAEVTSDLSTCEEIQNRTRRKKCLVQDAPVFTGLLNEIVLSKSAVNEHLKSNNFQKMTLSTPFKVNKTLSRPTSSSPEVKSFNDQSKTNISREMSLSPSPKIKKRLFAPSSSSQEYFYSYKSKNNARMKSFKQGTTAESIDELKTTKLKFSDTTRDFSMKTTSPVENDHFKSLKSSDYINLSNSSTSSTNFNDKMQNSSIVHTTCSPFKVTTLLHSSQHETNKLSKPANNSCEITGSENNFTVSTLSSLSHRNRPTTNSVYHESDSNETLKKILSVVMKIKYDVENITHNQNKMNDILTDTVINQKSINNFSQEDLTDDEDYSLLLPLQNEDALDDFENKLLSKPFRLKVVNGLKRFVKKSLTSTIRQMLRTIFDDELLQIFSYVGQKKKKIFSSLASCSIIFEAIRKIKNFHDVSNADIEMPIKIYIAGAAFRKKKIAIN